MTSETRPPISGALQARPHRGRARVETFMEINDPIGRMFKRGQLRRETDRDGKAAEARLKAARMWQSIYA
jgi:hypothetical protein